MPHLQSLDQQKTALMRKQVVQEERRRSGIEFQRVLTLVQEQMEEIMVASGSVEEVLEHGPRWLWVEVQKQWNPYAV